MTTPVDRPPPSSAPLFLDDDWVPPPPSSRFPMLMTMLVAGACVIVLTIGTAIWVFDQQRFAKDPEADAFPWSSIQPEPVPAGIEPEPLPAITAPAPGPAPVPAPAAAPAPAPVRRAAPSRPAFLAVNSTPWAELSLDGGVVGNTPQLAIRTTAGRHLLVFAREGFQPERRWVTVAPGATLRITDVTLTQVVR